MTTVICKYAKFQSNRMMKRGLNIGGNIPTEYRQTKLQLINTGKSIIMSKNLLKTNK